MKIAHTLFSWLITGIGGSILLLIGIAVFGGSHGHLLGSTSSDDALFVLVYGSIAALAFSIPAFMLYHLLGMLLYRNMQESMVVKALLSFYAALAPVLTLWLIALAFTGERNLFQRGGDSEVLYLLLPYMICFVACVWLLHKKQPVAAGDQYAPAADGFPREITMAIAIMVVISEAWGVVSLLKYWQYYHLFNMVYITLIVAVCIVALILLLRRKAAGWYILSVVTVWSVCSSLLGLGYAFIKKPEYLQGYSNAAWIFFFLVEVVLLVLLMVPAMRRYFRIAPERLGIVTIAGILLAAAFFFARL